jgi:hypothetical protein
MKPQHPAHKPYDIEGVFTAACGYFSNAQFYRPLQRLLRDEPSDRTSPWSIDPDGWIQRLFGREDRALRPLWHVRDSLRDRDLQRDRRFQLDCDRDTSTSQLLESETRRVQLKEDDGKPQA